MPIVILLCLMGVLCIIGSYAATLMADISKMSGNKLDFMFYASLIVACRAFAVALLVGGAVIAGQYSLALLGVLLVYAAVIDAGIFVKQRYGDWT